VLYKWSTYLLTYLPLYIVYRTAETGNRKERIGDNM